MQTSAPASAQIAAAAPTITLALSQVCADHVVLSGRVTGVDAAGATVNISGAKWGTVTADANGNFSFNLTLMELGSVSVSTSDSWMQYSNTAEISATSFPPIIQSFQATDQGNGRWVFVGTVFGMGMQGIQVAFGGLASLQGQTATVGSDGSFQFTVNLGQGEIGNVTAQAAKDGLQSNLANYYVS